MSTDRSTGGEQLDATPYASIDEGGANRMSAEDQYDNMLDKLRSDDFKGLCRQANETHAQQTDQLCLGSGGTITKGDPMSAYGHLGAQRAAAAAQAGQAPQPPTEDDELRQLRAMRMAQMQQEHTWRASGHGRLRELSNEADFIGVVRPRERAVVLLSDRASEKEAPEVEAALAELAKKHIEAQFCHLELEKAGILSTILDLEEGLPVVFVLKHGVVRLALPPRRLFEYASASSPMFPKHLARLLRSVGAIGSGVADANSDSGEESEEENGRRRR